MEADKTPRSSEKSCPIDIPVSPAAPPSYEEATSSSPHDVTVPSAPPLVTSESLVTSPPYVLGDRPPTYTTLPRQNHMTCTPVRRQSEENHPCIQLEPRGEYLLGDNGEIRDVILDDVIDNGTRAPSHVYIRVDKKIEKHTINGAKVREWPLPKDSGVTGGLALDTKRDVIVLTSSRKICRVTRLGSDPGCIYESSVLMRKAKDVSAVAFHAKSDRYVIIDGERNDVIIAKGGTGDSRLLRNSALKTPTSVSCHVGAKHGLIAISDSTGHDIKLIDIKGNLKKTLGCHGNGRCQLDTPRGVCMDSAGRVVVCDHGNQRVVRFAPGSDVTGSWSWECVLSPDQLRHRSPSHVDISETGHLVVTLCTTAESRTSSTNTWSLFSGYH